MATKRGDFEKVKQIFEKGEGNVNVQDKEGNSALHWGALHKDSRSHMEILKFLLNRDDVEVNIENNEEKQIPLEWAIIGKNIPALKLLIDHGANIHHTDKRQYNPLILATQHNLPIVCYYLIHLGIYPRLLPLLPIIFLPFALPSCKFQFFVKNNFFLHNGLGFFIWIPSQLNLSLRLLIIDKEGITYNLLWGFGK